jgi:hypothetical protein
MKSRSFALLAIGLVLTIQAPVQAQRRGRGRGDDVQAGQYGWLSSLDAGMTKARTSGKPLMVVIRCVP